MKSFIGAIIFICVALSANAQLLWKVSGNGLSSPSYIMGTHHLAPVSPDYRKQWMKRNKYMEN